MRRPPVSSTSRPVSATGSGTSAGTSGTAGGGSTRTPLSDAEILARIDGRRSSASGRIERGEISAKFKKAALFIVPPLAALAGLWMLTHTSGNNTPAPLVDQAQQAADQAFMNASDPKFSERTAAVTQSTEFLDRHLAKKIDGKPSATMAELQDMAKKLGKDDAFKTFQATLDGIYKNPVYGLDDQHALRNTPLPRQKEAAHEMVNAARAFRLDLYAGMPEKAGIELYKHNNAKVFFQSLDGVELNLNVAAGTRSGAVQLPGNSPLPPALQQKPRVENFPTTDVPAEPGFAPTRRVVMGGTVFEVPAQAQPKEAPKAAPQNIGAGVEYLRTLTILEKINTTLAARLSHADGKDLNDRYQNILTLLERSQNAKADAQASAAAKQASLKDSATYWARDFLLRAHERGLSSIEPELRKAFPDYDAHMRSLKTQVGLTENWQLREAADALARNTPQGTMQAATAPQATQPQTTKTGTGLSDARTREILRVLDEKAGHDFETSGFDLEAEDLHARHQNLGQSLADAKRVGKEDQPRFMRAANAWANEFLKSAALAPHAKQIAAEMRQQFPDYDAKMAALEKTLNPQVSGKVQPPAGYRPTNRP